MKTIGLIGGMSWESTTEYYRIINEAVSTRLGGFHSAKILMNSVDFGEIEPLMRSGDWESIARMLSGIAVSLEKAGADCILIATNTIHKVYDFVDEAVTVPMIHIADAAGEAVKAAGIGKVGLLGTRFTMEEDFYRGRLQDKFGIEVTVPDKDSRDLVDAVIFGELCLGVIKDESKRRYIEIIEKLAEDGAEGIILGCTEIPLLVSGSDVTTPLFDTTRIHALAAVDFALG